MNDRHDTAEAAVADALASFRGGFNCAESAARALLAGHPAAADVARGACGFGAGVARHGTICGALTGCAIALGAWLGRDDAADEAAKARTYAAIDAVVSGFEQRFGSSQCSALTGIDWSSPDASEAFRARGLFEGTCVPAVEHAVRAGLAALGRG